MHGWGFKYVVVTGMDGIESAKNKHKTTVHDDLTMTPLEDEDKLIVMNSAIMTSIQGFPANNRVLKDCIDQHDELSLGIPGSHSAPLDTGSFCLQQ